MEKILKKNIFIVALFFFPACSSVPIKDYPKHHSDILLPFYTRNFLEAAKALEEGSIIPGPDRLLFLLDRAIALHNLGEYKQSNEILFEAEKISSIEDYSKKTTLRSNNTENKTRKFYRGEEYEHVLLSFYQALNYIFLEKEKEAILELRRAESKLKQMQIMGERKYSMPPIFSYLGGILYEKQKEWLSSFSEYKRIFSESKNSLVSDPLIRSGLILQDPEISSWVERFLPKGQEWLRQKYLIENQGEIIIIVQNGKISRKEKNLQHEELSVIPEPHLRFTKSWLYIDGEKQNSGDTVFDINKFAQENIEEKTLQSLHDKNLGDQTGEWKRERLAVIRKKNNPFDASPRTVKLVADLRQWQTLPTQIQIIRAAVYPGVHRIMLQFENEYAQKSSLRDLGDVKIEQPGAIKILTYREF